MAQCHSCSDDRREKKMTDLSLYPIPLHTSSYFQFFNPQPPNSCVFGASSSAHTHSFPELSIKCSLTPTSNPLLLKGVERDPTAAHTDSINVLSFLQLLASDSGEKKKKYIQSSFCVCKFIKFIL